MSTILLAFPLFLWQRFHGSTDWAILLLLPLAWMLFSGSRKPLLATLQARSLLESQPCSPASVFSTGKVKATAFSLLFVVVTVPILALQALSAGPWTLLTMLILCVTSSAFVIWTSSWLTHYWKEPFATSRGIFLGSGLSAVLFFPLLLVLDSTLHSNECRSADFWLWEWFRFINPFRSVPEGGWVTGILEPLFLIECTKRKLTEMIGEVAVPVQILYSLSFATVTFIVARAAAATTCFVQELTRSRQVDRN
ncbi:MAG: hypothetical protein OXC05_09980 [Halieaceae bacterium]|nr:hypothetical protein [Halieaceae bacterium]